MCRAKGPAWESSAATARGAEVGLELANATGDRHGCENAVSDQLAGEHEGVLFGVETQPAALRKGTVTRSTDCILARVCRPSPRKLAPCS
jgi:hypothetical protein